jgi:hypothetical protein
MMMMMMMMTIQGRSPGGQVFKVEYLFHTIGGAVTGRNRDLQGSSGVF